MIRLVASAPALIAVILGLVFSGCTLQRVTTAPVVDTPPDVRSTPDAQTPVATPSPAPGPVPTAPPPAALPVTDLDAPRVRVLLQRSTDRVEFPQPGRAYRVTSGGGARWMWGPLTIDQRQPRAWQVGAFADAAAVEATVARLDVAFGEDIAISRQNDASDGLTRVRVSWPKGEPAAGAADRLASAGFAGAFSVPDGPSVIRIGGADGQIVEVRGETVLQPSGEWPTALGARSYRGRFRLRAAGGALLVINELNLESYLKGVVPVEMGPYQFPELDALKAQAVAARTYAVAHLGDHVDEGWDLCDTPACQAYHGTGAEHSLSSRAVEETAGLIATFAGQPIDAMYTSTCGGHTEDAGMLFDGRGAPYLKGVACAWERKLTLEGSAKGSGSWIDETQMLRRLGAQLLGLSPKAPEQAVIDGVSRLCGGTATRLGSMVSAEEYAAALLVAGGLDSAGRLFAKRGSAFERLLELSDLFGAGLAPPTEQWNQGWHLDAAREVLRIQGVFESDRGEAVPHPGGVAIYPRRAERSEVVSQPVLLFERMAGAVRELDTADLLPGAELQRFRSDDRVLAIVVERSGGQAEADRRSAWRDWTRERSWGDLARATGIADLDRLEVTARAPSGRVVGLAAHGRGGATKTWKGFPIRRVLDLPENLFSFHVITRANGDRAIRFLGRGWGHGVGMCQNGAYGLARAGRSFEEILSTYYTGIEIVKWTGSPARSKP